MPTKFAASLMGSREPYENTAKAIRAREPFKTNGSLQGGDIVGALSETGDLRGDALLRYQEDWAKNIEYVVMSYRTPIAWWTREGGWVRVSGTFSLTTTRHQSLVGGALDGYVIWNPRPEQITHRVVEQPKTDIRRTLPENRVPQGYPAPHFGQPHA